MKNDVSVIIANFNSEMFLDKCLSSLFHAKGNFEIIIVDDNSSDSSVSIIQKYKSDKRLTLIQLKRRVGPAKARNIGAAKSNGDTLLFLDSDTFVDEHCIEKLNIYLNKDDSIGGGQIKILNAENNRYDSSGDLLTPFGFLSERARSAIDVGQFDEVSEIFSGKAAGMFVRKNVFELIGGFDPEYFIFWEEPDLFWRIWKRGYKVIFFPFSVVWHSFATKEKVVSKDWLKTLTYYGCRNHIMTILKNSEGVSSTVMISAVVSAWIGLLISFLLKGDFPRSRAIWNAFSWILRHGRHIRTKRYIGKNKTWINRVMLHNSFDWYIHKGIAYILNKPY